MINKRNVSNTRRARESDGTLVWVDKIGFDSRPRITSNNGMKYSLYYRENE